MVDRSKVLVLVCLLLTATAADSRAQSGPARGAASIRQSISRMTFVGAATAWPHRQKPCDVKRRALAGAAIGSVVAMVAVRRAAESNGGNVGFKGTLYAAGYGAALGGVIGLTTCR